jgi:hypothetical protein
LERTKKLGVKLFEKPFKLSKLSDWIKNVEKQIPENRVLADWDVGGNQ